MNPELATYLVIRHIAKHCHEALTCENCSMWISKADKEKNELKTRCCFVEMARILTVVPAQIDLDKLWKVMNI